MDRLLLTAVAAWIAGSIGCAAAPSYPCADVDGTIEIDGKSVPRGTITFVPLKSDQGPVAGASITDGKFHVSRVPLGKHTVTLVAQAAELTTFIDAGGVERAVPVDILPRKYQDGLLLEVHADKNKMKLSLTTVNP